jgi:hypothetical protein
MLAASIGGGFPIDAGVGHVGAAGGAGAAAAAHSATALAGKGALSWLAWAGTKTVAGVAAAALATGIGATGVYLARREPPPEPRAMEQEPTALVVEAEPLPEPSPKEPVAEPSPPPPSSPPAEEATKRPQRKAAASSLAAERAVLDDARGALARGDAGAAFEALERHRRRHPDGALAEERDAMAVLTLLRLDRHEEAEAARARFVVRYPASLFRSVVEGVTR